MYAIINLYTYLYGPVKFQNGLFETLDARKKKKKHKTKMTPLTAPIIVFRSFFFFFYTVETLRGCGVRTPIVAR